ncbi:hypothetical protein N1851_011833 [Merluccius polli]|uniref:Uncharacterized protein n=1 Tax=Merluccius polli TaxID=89951 RepID=A0AA47MWZ8_MERPO|nr:hypothetical protein N1851_011833 [Merluccius polli]
MDDIERMEDMLKQTTEPDEHMTKALDTQFSQLCEPYITRGPLSALSKFELLISVLIEWPEWDVIQATVPMAFRQAFGRRVAVILDCLEIFIEEPSRVSCISNAWGGRVSLGFNVGDSVGLYCAFTKGKTQLSAFEVEKTRKIANVRIHVETSRTMPIEPMVTKPGDTLSMIDKIGVIYCALSNLSASVVPLE